MSGHSKWANIKHKKGATDAKRGKIFTRISKEITVAARLGGGDITGNPRLRIAVQNGRAANMSMDTIQRAIQKGTGELEGVSYEEMRYEGYAPCSVAVILEAVTDNKNRTVAELRNLFTKGGGSLGEANSVAWNFTRKGAIQLESSLNEDEMFDLVVESGAEDMEQSENGWTVYCATDVLAQCQKFFESKNIVVKESKFEFLPSTTVKIETIEDARKLMKFIDLLEEYEDTQNLFANYEMDDELLENL